MPLHDLVPLYLTPRTPTLSIRRDIQSELFFLDISLDAVCDDLVPFAFTDGNAGSNNTKFFCNLGKLSEISWDVISARYWNDYDDGKRKRCSEFLIYPGIKPRYFERIVVLTAPLAQQCAATVKQSGVDLKVVVLRDYFFV